MQNQTDALQKSSVTVIIITFNSTETIFKCLDALSRQTFQPSRVIVVDNASADGSVSMMKEHFPLIDCWAQSVNLGFALGNNYAIESCTTELVALLNPDAFPEANWLEQLMKAANRHPQSASFGSRQINDGDKKIVDGLGDVYHVSGLVWRHGYGRLYRPENLEDSEIFSPCAGAALYRLEALNAVGGFDEDFFCYVEDVDLGFRLRLAGWKSIYVPAAVVMHVGGSSTGGRHSNFSLYHGHRNLVWAYVKNMPSFLFWIFLPIHIVLNIVTIVWFIFRGKGAIILKAKMDAVKGLPKILDKRKQVQIKRKALVSDILRILNKDFFK